MSNNIYILNEQEKTAKSIGYLCKMNRYVDLMDKLLNRINSNENEAFKRYYRMIKLYCYTLFENMWHGYLIAYSDVTKMNYMINNYSLWSCFQFRNNLPAFSSSIMHFGTCRDLSIVVVELVANHSQIESIDEFKGIVGIRSNREKFTRDLNTLSNSDNNYVQLGLKVFDNNLIRNIYAHRIRLPWWHNKNCNQIDYFITRVIYNSLLNKDNNTLDNELYFVISDIEQYQTNIENADCDEIVGSSYILRNIHDVLLDFMNQTFELIKNNRC